MSNTSDLDGKGNRLHICVSFALPSLSMDITLIILVIYGLIYYFVLSYLSWTSICVLASVYSVFAAYTAKNHGEMANERFRRSGIINFLRRYFEFEIDNANELSDEPVIYAAYPHGILPISLLVGYGLHGSLPQIANRVVISPHFFKFPIIRELCLYGGAIAANGRSMMYQFEAGRSVILTPEGAHGVLAARNYVINFDSIDTGYSPGHYDTVKWAWNSKIAIIPVFNTGEERIFWTNQYWLSTLREFMIKRFGYCFPLFCIGPFRAKITSHIGAKVTPRISETDTLSDFRKRFCVALATLIDHHASPSRTSKKLNRWINETLDLVED